jgi:catechol-2,3-dioxygenase
MIIRFEKADQYKKFYKDIMYLQVAREDDGQSQI